MSVFCNPSPFASSEVERPRAGVSTSLDTNGTPTNSLDTNGLNLNASAAA